MDTDGDPPQQPRVVYTECISLAKRKRAATYSIPASSRNNDGLELYAKHEETLYSARRQAKQWGHACD